MRMRWPVVAVFSVLGFGYALYPYVTLWRLDAAVRGADEMALQGLVDWYAVREGLKEDLCDIVLEEPDSTRPSDELPPFGSGFVRGITGTWLEQRVTPESVVLMARPENATAHGKTHVIWAFFQTPISFAIDLRADDSREPIRMVMELRGARWLVRRIWLPADLLERVGSGT
jgi:hypothetical protein